MSIQKSRINIINNPSKSFIQTNFIEPNKQQLNQAGQLFVLSEINRPEKNAEKIIFIINQLLEKNYYLNEKIFLSENINSLKIESIFESALVKSNRELLEFMDQERLAFDFKSLSIIVGIIYEDQIHFSSMGLNKSYLIRDVEKSYQISDINPDGGEQEMEELSSGKIFSSIITGEIPEKSYIIFCNDSLSQYLLNDDFIKILEKLKLEGATEQIKNLLNKINNYSNFCGLLIKNFPHQVDRQEFKYNNSDLLLAEKRTEKMLTNAGSIDTQKLSKNIKNKFSKVNIFLNKIIKAILKIKLFKFKKTESRIKDINEVVITNDKRKKLRNALFIVVGVLVVALIINSFFKKNTQNEILVEENVSNFEELIMQKQSKIDSALLYNNESLAKEAIVELKNLLNSMTDKEKNKVKNYSEIETKLNEQLAKIQKIILVNNPEELGNFSAVEALANVSAISLFKSTNKIYAFDASTNSIYLLNLENKVLSKLTKNDAIKNKGLSTIERNEKIYFLSEDQVVSIDKQEKISFNKIKIENYAQISSFDVYNNRPYLLNQELKQIKRYDQMPKDELTNSTDWIKEGGNINPIYLVTDFSIFVLDQSGTVYKFLEGKKDAVFATENIEPALSSADILRVGEKYLYVVDKISKRMVVYSKETGKFVNQYQGDKFDDIRDIMIDEGKNKAYILNANIVYSINLTF